MGQQQLLLLVLGIVIVGLAVVVGISALEENRRTFRQDQTIHLMMDLASKAQLWKMAPAVNGGGGASSESDFSAFTLGAIGLVPTSSDSSGETLLRTEYACLKVIARSDELQIDALDTMCSDESRWLTLRVTGIEDSDITTTMNADNAGSNGL